MLVSRQEYRNDRKPTIDDGRRRPTRGGDRGYGHKEQKGQVMEGSGQVGNDALQRWQGDRNT